MNEHRFQLICTFAQNHEMKVPKLTSVLHSKCPRCLEGELYTDTNPYKLNRLFDMHEDCPVCGLHYEREPGFFFGAMYVSYSLTIALAVAIWVVISIFAELEFWWYIIIITTGIVVLSPLVFRLSRTIWLNMFYSYDPNAGK